MALAIVADRFQPDHNRSALRWMRQTGSNAKLWRCGVDGRLRIVPEIVSDGETGFIVSNDVEAR